MRRNCHCLTRRGSAIDGRSGDGGGGDEESESGAGPAEDRRSLCCGSVVIVTCAHGSDDAAHHDRVDFDVYALRSEGTAHHAADHALVGCATARVAPRLAQQQHLLVVRQP